MAPDFPSLYAELGLTPDCSLEEFKQAYRRRIAQLHPDRRGAAAYSGDARALLSELTAGYMAITRFHRQYGRMPGSVGHAAAFQRSRPAARPLLSDSASGDDTRPPRPAVWVLVLLLALLVLLLSWDWMTAGSG